MIDEPPKGVVGDEQRDAGIPSAIDEAIQLTQHIEGAKDSGVPVARDVRQRILATARAIKDFSHAQRSKHDALQGQSRPEPSETSLDTAYDPIIYNDGDSDPSWVTFGAVDEHLHILVFGAVDIDDSTRPVIMIDIGTAILALYLDDWSFLSPPFTQDVKDVLRSSIARWISDVAGGTFAGLI